MRIKIVVDVDKEDRERLAQFLGKKKPADYNTCKLAFVGAIEAEKDSWYLETEG